MKRFDAVIFKETLPEVQTEGAEECGLPAEPCRWVTRAGKVEIEVVFEGAKAGVYCKTFLPRADYVAGWPFKEGMLAYADESFVIEHFKGDVNGAVAAFRELARSKSTRNRGYATWGEAVKVLTESDWVVGSAIFPSATLVVNDEDIM